MTTKEMETKMDNLVGELSRLQTETKHKFTSIEVILMAYFSYWTAIIALPIHHYLTYSIYADLSKMISERNLACVMGLGAIALLAGCFIGLKWLRLTGLMFSMIVWLIIALSFAQVNIENMRGSVIILAVASGFQFIQVAKLRRRLK
jgi:hypothetical protein